MTHHCAHCGQPLDEPIPVHVAYCSPGCREAAEDAGQRVKLALCQEHPSPASVR